MRVFPGPRRAVHQLIGTGVLALLLGSKGAVLRAQLADAARPLTMEQIAARMQQRDDSRRAALRSYESRRTMRLAYNGILTDKGATETVDVMYTAPATKRFTVLTTEGSPLLRENVFAREMQSEQEATARGEIGVTPTRYTMQLLGTERLPEGDCYVLQVSPRNQGQYGFVGKVWVHSRDFAVVRIEARPVQTPSFWLKDGEFRTDFAKVGDFWLPQKMVSTSRVRLGGHATLTIDYGAYRILSAAPLPPLPEP